MKLYNCLITSYDYENIIYNVNSNTQFIFVCSKVKENEKLNNYKQYFNALILNI